MTMVIIPARGGSKRILRKNIRPFLDKPIIAWSIEIALESGLFEHVIVSTDDDEIATMAEQYGATAPFRRPAELSDDHTGTSPVVAHAIRWAMENGLTCDPVCCIYATAPFVTATDLITAHELLKNSGKDYVFTVTPFEYPVQRALRLTKNGGVELLQSGHKETRSQDLEQSYHDAGQFYWGRAEAFLKSVPLFSEAAAPLVLPPHRVQDIDTEEDWRRAELMMRILQAEKEGS